MSVPQATSSVATSDLLPALERALRDSVRVGARIVDLRRRLSAYSSSFLLEDLTVVLDDGTTLDLVFKDITEPARLRISPPARPSFAFEPGREIHAYRTLLAGLGLGTATYYGSVEEHGTPRYWLFLERVAGLQLQHVGEMTTWEAAARWLATAHNRLARVEERSAGGGLGWLRRYDGDYYRKWLARAQDFTEGGLAAVAEGYDEVVERLLALPCTIVHGEFYASNVLVREQAGGVRLCPVDWESVGVGPGLIDLAALVSGRWTDAERARLVDAYVGAVPDGAWLLDADATSAALTCCRLFLAVQWLGWTRQWSPPAQHERNWLGEARELAEALRP